MEFEVTSQVARELLDHAARAHPEECCGILLGSAARIVRAEPAANVHPAPETHFEIDPAALIAAHKAMRAGGEAIVGYFHSHPQGEAIPSATDRAMAAHDGSVWAIVAGESLRLWRDEADGFTPLPYRLVAR